VVCTATFDMLTRDIDPSRISNKLYIFIQTARFLMWGFFAGLNLAGLSIGDHD